MIVRIRTKTARVSALLLLGIFALSAVFFGLIFSTESVTGAINITNRSVLAIVNVTNTEPNITSVVVDDNLTTVANEIDLIANNVTIVHCNSTIFDYNGWQDINPASVNATLFINSMGSIGATDNNHRYRNESCNSCSQGTSSTQAICVCQFAVQYYANDSNQWLCNVSARDMGGTALSGQEINFTDYGISTAVTVTKLLAIDVGPLIDYGNLSVTQTSGERVHNVTNVGNINLNLSLRGYGGQDEALGTNVTMVCQFGNISFGQQRYEFGTDRVGGTAFGTMTNLSNQTRPVNNSTMYQRIDDSTFGWDRNSTIWRLQVPLTVGGLCNGTIIFGAVDAEV